jgi:hypothetical protein
MSLAPARTFLSSINHTDGACLFGIIDIGQNNLKIITDFAVGVIVTWKAGFAYVVGTG